MASLLEGEETITTLMKMGILMKNSLASRFSFALLLLLIRVADFQFPVGEERRNNLIDCGNPEASNANYSEFMLKYVPDDGFIQTGLNQTIQGDGSASDVPNLYRTLRSFPNYTRNCYSLPAFQGERYIIRASFMYGNYDGLNKVPTFNIYYGVDLWDTIKLDNATHMLWTEMVVQAAGSTLSVCLVNTGRGTPFISGLEQRLVGDDLYGPAKSMRNTALNVFRRINVGAKGEVRYPDDQYDRIWSFDYGSYGRPVVESQLTVNTGGLPNYVPATVFQTAVYAATIIVSFPASVNGSCYLSFYFADLVARPEQSRTMHVSFNGNSSWETAHAFFEQGSVLFSKETKSDDAAYRFSIRSANASDPLGAVLNGYEVYRVNQLSGLQTFTQDVAAIQFIRDHYHVKKNWIGDPCLPEGAPWDGLTCLRDQITNIVELDLSNSGLNGSIIEDFSNMTYLRRLNLSGNSLCGSIPSSLQPRVDNGALKLSIDHRLPPCSSEYSKSKTAILLPLLSSLLALAILTAAVLYFMVRRLKIATQGLGTETDEEPLHENFHVVESGIRSRKYDLPLFDFKTIMTATDNFSDNNKLGEGGFGPVFKGLLDGGQEIAVKRLSKSSKQGFDEFMNEVEVIAKLQHKNLVRLVGCCAQRKELILAYEYMPNKSLDALLFDPTVSVKLEWDRRFQIVTGTAKALQYLHHDSRLKVVHRDLKASNILLDHEMNPRVSDFGLARIFGAGEQSQLNTLRVVGTCGYMSPEYALEGRYSAKSDVFSFGVVVLEILSGQRMTRFMHNQLRLNLLGYAWELWKEGRIVEFLDPVLCGNCDLGQLKRCIKVGLLCVQEDAEDRPTMTSVLLMLSETNTENMPEPKLPAFSLRKRYLPESTESDSVDPATSSVENVTASSMGAR